MTDRAAVMQFAQEDPWAAWAPQNAQQQAPSNNDPFAPAAPVNMAEDVARSSVTGAQRGAAGLAGILGDVQEIGPQSAGFMRYWQLRSQGLSDEEARAGAQRSIDAVRTFNQRPGGVQFPTSQDINRGIEQTFGEQYEPQTTAGEYARNIAGFWPNAVFPGGAGARVARMVVPGAASEAAGQMTQGTEAEPYARMAGALGGGIAAEYGINLGNAPDRMLAVALEGATDADLVAAQQLQERARSMGIDLTRAEALEQVTHGGTGMTALQDFVETSRHGAPVMAPYMRNRPEQTASAINNWADRVAPPTPNPSMLGVQGQRAADEILTAERRAINTRAQGNYDALTNETMPDAEFAQIMGDPTFQQTLNTVRSSPILNSGLEALPDNNLAVINRVAQQMRQMSENTLPNPNRETGSHFMSSQYSRGASATEDAASQASQQYAQPSNWDEARRIESEGRAATLDPLKAGPLGRMARTPDVMGPTGQTRSLFPDAPPAGGAAETEEAMRRLVQADPDTASGLARQHVLGGRTGAQEQLQALSGGENQFGMAKWAATIAGNPEQQQALIAGFRALPNGQRLADELADLIEVGQATGRRAAAGSRTAMRTEYGEQARSVIPEGTKLASNVFRGGRVRKLAEFLTDHPSETAAALRAARKHGNQPVASSMLSTLILSRPKGEREHAR